MKILFVTAYDEQTYANLRIANHIVEQNDTILFEEHATRDALHRCISKDHNNEIMIMSHGDDNLVRDNNKNSAISELDYEIFREAKIYIWACNTGKKLGSVLSNYNNICWGYNIPVTALSSHHQNDIFFIPLFKEIKGTFASGYDESSIMDIIENIKEKCEEILDMIDAEDKINPIEDIISLYSCCMSVWQNLIVWLDSKKIQHPEAPSIQYLDL